MPASVEFLSEQPLSGRNVWRYCAVAQGMRLAVLVAAITVLVLSCGVSLSCRVAGKVIRDAFAFGGCWRRTEVPITDLHQCYTGHGWLHHLPRWRLQRRPG
jgi:hypothetical protein